ncbi:MAG: TetM/TetW/TetO/TetS family tetracycline resistance ribosomal protection protein [Parasporobacterium sp.]|nr:TetM/TetW/TetO/TetS family tetracycline resistance ribosomal protection protein [Parasporobacterium sp.]
MKKITIGIVAHVDSGKTTLSEALLYLTGTIRSFGRVDKGASFLDDHDLERRRGITIYSKQARFTFGNTEFILIDTPGHADFSAEMERSLQVLDYAVLLISAADGIKGQTEMLWRLLEEYRIPVFVFFNKMDQDGADPVLLRNTFRTVLASELVDFSARDPQELYDQAAMCTEEAMEEYLSTGSLTDDRLRSMIKERKLFPGCFGSALKMEGVREFLELLDRLTLQTEYPPEFGARVFKIIRDPDGSRVTMMKITGGSLPNKSVLPDGQESSKINQIRIYNGGRFTLRDEAFAGEICGVTGLKESCAGQGFGTESESFLPLLAPILSYRAVLPPEQDAVKVLPWFRTLEEENPELSVSWEEDRQEIHVCVMGEVQLEILKTLLKERFSLETDFDNGEVMYRETIASPVIGSGHFEPLRHFAEVHLRMEPAPRGSGLVFESELSSDVLSRNWQRLILTHLGERQHRGVLTGAPVTDMKIVLIGGKAHLKHTEGGDFRQAVYRAVRQGLMKAENLLLEPYYRFVLEIPASAVGRAMTDLDRMEAGFSLPEQDMAGKTCVIRGRGPVSSLKDYASQIAAYTKGQGRIRLINDGYDLCRNAEEVIRRKGYDPAADLKNPADSVFCAHGSGIIVPYDQVDQYMEIPDFKNPSRELSEEGTLKAELSGTSPKEIHLGTEEVDEIISRISRSNSKEKKTGKNWKKTFGTREPLSAPGAVSPNSGESRVFPPEEAEYVLVDGYNVIFAWKELSDLARVNIDSARDALIEILSNFRSMISAEVIAVFDAYRVKGHATEQQTLQNIRIVYTAEEETADQYIEKFTNENGKKQKILVVTSDSLEQVITRGQGCMLISSREFQAYLERLQADLREKYLETH